MDINSTAVDAAPHEVKLTYPYIGMMDTGISKTIALLTGVNTGVILLSEADTTKVGHYTDLNENKYTPYYGSVTLSM